MFSVFAFSCFLSFARFLWDYIFVSLPCILGPLFVYGRSTDGLLTIRSFNYSISSGKRKNKQKWVRFFFFLYTPNIFKKCLFSHHLLKRKNLDKRGNKKVIFMLFFILYLFPHFQFALCTSVVANQRLCLESANLLPVKVCTYIALPKKGQVFWNVHKICLKLTVTMSTLTLMPVLRRKREEKKLYICLRVFPKSQPLSTRPGIKAFPATCSSANDVLRLLEKQWFLRETA